MEALSCFNLWGICLVRAKELMVRTLGPHEAQRRQDKI